MNRITAIKRFNAELRDIFDQMPEEERERVKCPLGDYTRMCRGFRSEIEYLEEEGLITEAQAKNWFNKFEVRADCQGILVR